MSQVSLSQQLKEGNLFAEQCPSREVLKHVTSRWGVLILVALREGTHRFSDLRRKIGGVSEKMLAQSLQALEQDGFLNRIAYPVVPPHVEYSLTPLGEQGNNLSVGQKQLLALARVLVETPQILILDEATASIDSGTEQAIQHALAAVREHTTLVVIAHRLSTIVDADTILVLHRGQAVEQGTHQQLLAAQGRYWQMYQLQLAGEELAASVREEESLSA